MNVAGAMSFVSHIECSECGKRHDPARLLTVCEACRALLLVRYDLQRVAATVSPAWASRPLSMYRYRELLPLFPGETPVSLGEGGTPLLPLPRLGQRLGLTHLLGKDEGRNPTGTFKARGLSLAVTRARGFGVSGLILPSAGNAGGAAAAYGARAGLPVAVVVPRETPEAATTEALLAGAYVFTVDGMLSLAGQVAARAASALGFLDLSTLKEPYRLEGKKTMGLELAEQLDWITPDVIVYPTGGGTGLLGIWKAFQELIALGWIAGKGPRLIAVQAAGCAPVVRAWQRHEEQVTPWEDAVTVAAGLRVPKPFGDRLILRTLRESGGDAITVSDEELLKAQRLLAETEGLWVGPEAAATVAALPALIESGQAGREERIVLLLTGSGLKGPLAPSRAPIALSGDPAALPDLLVNMLRSSLSDPGIRDE